jgi:hypothetical protein
MPMVVNNNFTTPNQRVPGLHVNSNFCYLDTRPTSIGPFFSRGRRRSFRGQSRGIVCWRSLCYRENKAHVQQFITPLVVATQNIDGGEHLQHTRYTDSRVEKHVVLFCGNARLGYSAFQMPWMNEQRQSGFRKTKRSGR